MRRTWQAGSSVRSSSSNSRAHALFAFGLIAAAVLAGCSAGIHVSSETAQAPHQMPSVAKVTPSTKPTTPAPPVGVLVAWARVSSLPVYAAPGGREPAQSLANPNNLGAPLVLLVNDVHQGWVQAYLPERPNESLGWTLAADVSMVRDSERIVVSLSRRTLELFKGDSIVFQTVVAVGSPDSPTPTGHFYVTERVKVADPENSPYGPYVLGLSGFSNTYATFDGGPGQIAIHGTDEPWYVGQYASHGCVRLTNAEITALESQVEVGTPVDIIE